MAGDRIYQILIAPFAVEYNKHYALEGVESIEDFIDRRLGEVNSALIFQLCAAVEEYIDETCSESSSSNP